MSRFPRPAYQTTYLFVCRVCWHTEETPRDRWAQWTGYYASSSGYVGSWVDLENGALTCRGCGNTVKPGRVVNHWPLRQHDFVLMKEER